MEKKIESYKLGRVNVLITESRDPNKLHVDCHDGTYHSEFTVNLYEYKNYKRHMNQKISQAYRSANENDDGQA